MSKKSIIDKISGKKTPAPTPSKEEVAKSESQHVEGEVDHLWMKEDLDAKKSKLEKDPRIDTGILRDRIADKIAKLNNN
jgi:hypothetical protein